MDLLVAGLIGVALGALVASAIILHLVDRRADRDLIERRIRTFHEYLDCLGNLERAFDGAADDPRVLEQAWCNVRAFCREFRMSGWILSPAARAALARIVDELEASERSLRSNGSGGGRAAQLLCERYHEVERIVRRELPEEERAFRAFRFLARRARRGEG